jgi:FkbM family methyltransferase
MKSDGSDRPSAVGQPVIFDIGMSEGNDTDFYLRKGFKVVGVEADPEVCETSARRFAEAIQQNRLAIVNRAAAESDSEPVVFWRDKKFQGHSSVINAHLSDDVEQILVETISYPTLCEIYGAPYYVKIDIEGGEPPFLKSMGKVLERPQFISAECRNLRPIEVIHDLGYRYFKLVNQVKLPEFTLPRPAREGQYAERPVHWEHWSGPFGREAPGKRWFSYAEIRELWLQLHELWKLETLIVGWFDCHACRDAP